MSQSEEPEKLQVRQKLEKELLKQMLKELRQMLKKITTLLTIELMQKKLSQELSVKVIRHQAKQHESKLAMGKLIYGDSFIDIEKKNGLEDWYLNPNNFQDMSNRLHVCETLFGDFDAKLMILLQDAADEQTLLNQKKKTPESPLRHNPEIRTNKKLIVWLKDYFNVDIDGVNAKNCGVYLANAVWLIKKGYVMRAPIRKKKAVLIECSPVLDATIANLKNLRLIMTFGQIAYESIALKFKITLTWHEALKQEGAIKVEGYVVGAFPHPAARGIDINKIKGKISHLLLESNFVKV